MDVIGVVRATVGFVAELCHKLAPPLEGGFFMSPSTPTPKTTPKLRALYALRKARELRHTPDCTCGIFNGYCNADDQLWSERIDRELDSCR